MLYLHATPEICATRVIAIAALKEEADEYTLRILWRQRLDRNRLQKSSCLKCGANRFLSQALPNKPKKAKTEEKPTSVVSDSDIDSGDQ
jgi:hypothetical protein